MKRLNTKAALLVATGLALVPLHAANAVQTPITFKLLTRDIVVETDGTYVDTSHEEVTATNESAAHQLAQQTVSFSESMEDVDIVDAYTLKADGTRIPVAPSAIVVQAPPGAQSALIDDRKQKLILFPNVAAGDTIVYTTKDHVRHPFLPGYFTLADAVPRTVSIEEARATIVVPKAMPLKVETHGLTFTKEEGDTTTTYRWTYHGPDALIEDNAQLAALDVNPRYFASSFKDYDELARVYASVMAPSSEVTPKIAAQADLITAGISDRRQQAAKIYDWVSSHIRYVGIELGRGAVVPRSAESVLANGYGDCKDHTVIFAALLKAKGIDSETVLVNLDNDYILSDVPTLPGQFNHVITWLPEFALYADTTAGVAPFGVLPAEEYGKPVVHVGATGNALRQIPVMPLGTSMSVRTTSKLDATGKLTGETKTMATGSVVIDLRLYGQKILSLGPESAAATVLQSWGYPGATGTFDLAPPDQLGPDYSITGRFEVAPQPQYLAGAAFEMPGGLRLFQATGNWLMGTLWNYKLTADDPTPCYSGHTEEELSLELPAGKRLVKLPSDTTIADKHVQFTARWSTDGHTITVKRDFNVTVDQALCTGDLRKEAAKALAAIRDSYNTAQLSLADAAGT